MSGIMQTVLGGSFGAPPPPAIGSAYGGGFYAGRINVSGTLYNLVVAPKASGEASYISWGIYGALTGQTSVIDGPTNSSVEAALGASYQAATFCEGLTIGGFSDWYLPAKNELEVLYYFLKPLTNNNSTASGSNANAVSPEPISTNYTTGSPSQTSAVDFIIGGAEAFATDDHWTSTEASAVNAWRQSMINGTQGTTTKSGVAMVRAVRRIAV
jgi:hypothetical protein